MKFLAVFVALFAVAFANNTWTLQQLSDALQNPHTDATLKPYLEHALNDMMNTLWAGEQIDAVTVTIPANKPSSWTLDELSEMLQDPTTDPTLVPYLEALLNQMMEALIAGAPVEAAIVATPAMEIHHYSLDDLSAALADPTTNPELKPYLEVALNSIMDALFSGQQMESIVIAVPAGLTPVVPTEVIPAPVDVVAPAPVLPVDPATPVQPETPASPSSPLVQIIVNINQQQQAAAVPVEIAPTPVQVVDSAPIVDPVQVVDQAPVSPVQVVDQAPVSPVQVVDQAPVSPVQVVDVSPVQVVDQAPVSPVQVVDVSPVQVIETAPVAVEPVIIGTPVLPAPAVVLPEQLN